MAEGLGEFIAQAFLMFYTQPGRDFFQPINILAVVSHNRRPSRNLFSALPQISERSGPPGACHSP